MDTGWKCFGWIASDVATLLGLDLVLSIICYRWQKLGVIRTSASIGVAVYIWAFLNAGWIIRTGTQILPTVLIPFFRAPLDALGIVGASIVEQPFAAAIILLPSAALITFYVLLMLRPLKPDYNSPRFKKRLIVCAFLVLSAVLARGLLVKTDSVLSEELSYNCHLKAFMMFFNDGRISQDHLDKAARQLPQKGEIKVASSVSEKKPNVVVVILEGVQYEYTSLADNGRDLTPYLKRVADDGVSFANMRCSLMHTTKAVFSLITGRWACPSQDLSETVPVNPPYESIATILERSSGYRTAFFQSAKGGFEARAGLVSNLGFDYFWSREDSGDEEKYVGSLGSDEFLMLDAAAEWLGKENRNSFTVLLCSVTHDPYEVPAWYGEPKDDLIERYKQTIRYTDQFLRELDVRLKNIFPDDDYVLCIVGDHGEAFGEHGFKGHERIAYEEVLHIPWVMRGRCMESGKEIEENTSSVDFAPTLLSVLGYEVDKGDMDGVDVLSYTGGERKLYFSGWLQESPIGFVQGENKYFYNPQTKKVLRYNLAEDPAELNRTVIEGKRAEKLRKELFEFRKNSIFKIDQAREGEKLLYNKWRCRWKDRVSEAEYIIEEKDQQ
jgi:arylsulfatase A-like enzyme